MAGQKHVGYLVFTICSILAARLELFDVEPPPQVLTAAEERWGTAPKREDTLGFVRGIRFYIYGVGVVGLLLVVEDHFTAQSRKKRAAATPSAKPPAADLRDP